MVEEEEQGRPEVPIGDLFGDVPLLREIQRVLLASRGPVNWELARQVGIATAQWDKEDPEPTAADRQGLEDDVRLAELRVAGFTGLPAPTDVAKVLAVRRTGWVQETIGTVRDSVEPAAARIADAIASARPEGVPEGTAGALGQMLSQVAPLVLGAQAGTVIGHLARQVLGQYDVLAPRTGPSTLLFVVANIASFERDWRLPPREFRAFVALHEVTHRFEFARPWSGEHFRQLLRDFHATLEIDVQALHERLSDISVTDPEGLERMLGSEEAVFGAVLDDEQRLKLGRIQAFVIGAEGYGDHVAHAIAAQMLPSYVMIEEALRRYRAAEKVDPVFQRLLGIEVPRDRYRAGRAFCDTVAELTDEATLGKMWESPEALPSLPEIEEPRLWLARTA
ncbi:MAG TPA: zinc-dependent metalloprotease [Actinomycetota bacterium]|nr:zinc-dependent metalloprotease [Actinomycetota bacterium]